MLKIIDKIIGRKNNESLNNGIQSVNKEVLNNIDAQMNEAKAALRGVVIDYYGFNRDIEDAKAKLLQLKMEA